MKIQKIHISSYKNILEQTLILSGDKYTTLIGTNGSGKSNWLEAISSIFLSLYIKQPINMKYNMVYSFSGQTYSVVDGRITKGTQKVSDIKQVLPDKVIACYSGEDQRLWNKFYKPDYDRFFNDAIKNVYQEPEMIYINKYHWTIALISLLCSDREDIRHFLSNIFNVDGKIDNSEISVHILFNNDNIDKFKQTDAAKFVRRLQAEEDLRISHIATYDIGARDNADHCRKLYFYLYLLSLPKINDINKVSKAIESIDISINGFNIDKLSEGHKKLILIKFITTIIGTENSIILLDEPDAHTHIASKKDILTSIQNCQSQTILTTHSPVFIDMMVFDNLRYIESGSIINMDRIRAIAKISDGGISILNGALILSSLKPLILVEGIGDVNYINKSIELLGNNNPAYSLSCDILFMGGAGENAKQFIDKIRPHINDKKKVIVIFDRDDSGAEGMKKIVGTGNREDFKTYKNQNWYFLMLPKTPEHTETDFTIEDYFSLEYKTNLAMEKINEAGGYFKKIPKDLRQNVKDALSKKMDEYTADEMSGFAILLDKINRILEDKETNIVNI